jgi:excisionase family DNA binding protein
MKKKGENQPFLFKTFGEQLQAIYIAVHDGKIDPRLIKNKNRRRLLLKTLTVKEAAKEVKRTEKTIYRWIDEGFLMNIIRVRDGYLIPESEIKRIKVIINPQI